MPVLDFVLAELPAQLDELAVAKRREVDQPLERTLELDAHAVEAQHSLEQLLFGTLDSVLRLLLPLAVAAIRAGPLHRVLGHPQLLLEVGPQGGELGDLSHDRAHTRQLPVRFFHGVRAEPLHRSTILRSMDASAMRSRILEARVARLATADAEGRPHIVPISFALDGETMFFAVDAKPKRGVKPGSRVALVGSVERAFVAELRARGAEVTGNSPAPRACDLIFFAVDAKPKRTTDLKRLRNIAANPAVAVLFDHYEDDWSRLWWVRIDGAARIVADELAAARAIDLLAGRYEQYLQARPGGPVVAISIERMSGWSAR